MSLLGVETLAPRYHVHQILIQMHDQALGACRLRIFARCLRRGLGIALGPLTASFQVYLLLVTLAALDHVLGVAPVDSATCSCFEQL